MNLGLPLAPFAWENLPLDRRSRLLARPIYAATRRLLAGSAGAAIVARRAGCLAPCTVAPQVGVDPAAIPSRETRRAGQPPTALFVARLDRKKGADLLIAALALAKKWRAIIVGDGAERDALGAQAARLGVADRVEFRGAVSHASVPALYAQADAFVLPSRSAPGWVEQFGHVLAWAMAAGLPVVASRCGAVPEVVGGAGLLTPEDDAPAIAAALDRLRDVALARELGERGRARAIERFTDDAVAQRLERALRMALERDDADVLD
jgi:glycosyltransferase involved in cell wall biosynthesis